MVEFPISEPDETTSPPDGDELHAKREHVLLTEHGLNRPEQIQQWRKSLSTICAALQSFGTDIDMDTIIERMLEFRPYDSSHRFLRVTSEPNDRETRRYMAVKIGEDGTASIDPLMHQITTGKSKTRFGRTSSFEDLNHILAENFVSTTKPNLHTVQDSKNLRFTFGRRSTVEKRQDSVLGQLRTLFTLRSLERVQTPEVTVGDKYAFRLLLFNLASAPDTVVAPFIPNGRIQDSVLASVDIELAENTHEKITFYTNWKAQAGIDCPVRLFHNPTGGMGHSKLFMEL